MRKSDRKDWIGLAWIAVGTLALTLCLTAPAWAQQCHTYAELAEIITKRNGEEPVAMSMTSAGTTLVFYVHPETDKWTILEISPDGQCARIPAFGQAWRHIEPKPKGERL